MKCKQTVYNPNKVEKIRIQTDCCKFFPLFNVMFFDKIDLPNCLVVFFVVCPHLRPF